MSEINEVIIETLLGLMSHHGRHISKPKGNCSIIELVDEIIFEVSDPKLRASELQKAFENNPILSVYSNKRPYESYDD